MDDEPEIWKPVIRNLNYEVSNRGRIRRCVGGQGTRIGKILKCSSNGRYHQVGLFRNNMASRELVHILVAAAFIGPCPDGKEVNHKDACRTHNWSTNLEYCTPIENMEHASRNGLLRIGERNHQTKLTDDQVIWIREQVAGGRSRRSVAKELGLSFQYVGEIVSKKKRLHL